MTVPASSSLSIFGVTGSIGRTTAHLVKSNPESYRVRAVSAHRNVEELANMARALSAEMAVIADEGSYAALEEALSSSGIRAAAGAAALVEAASLPVDRAVLGIMGAAGLEPALAAARQGTVLALANKECLVCAGELLLEEVRRHGATLIPVDSEHNAIYQVFDQNNPASVEALILTASGGPFRRWTQESMERARPQEAVAHPNWSMGAKISIDSATMMNKGLEMIEAWHLFPVAESQIKVIVHPESIIHSMVQYVDGSMLAQLGPPDMAVPIGYALAWPDRLNLPQHRLDLATIGQLTFEEPDPVRFPALRLARTALAQGGTAPTVLNAANEVAVQRFMEGQIGFLDIARCVEKTMEKIDAGPLDCLETVYAYDREARRLAEAWV